jgi:chaperonin GroES
MHIKPIGNRVLVKQAKAEETTKSGIFIPDTVSKDKGSLYEIVALGNGEAISKLGLQVGTKVIGKQYGGDTVVMEDDKDTEYKILFVSLDQEEDESDLIAVVE